MENKILIDWISFTTTISSETDIIKLLGMDHIPFEVLDGIMGFQGFTRACSHKKSIKNHCKHNYRQKNRVQLIIASTNLSKTFDSEEKTFHLVSLFI